MIKDEYETERKVHSSVGGLACLVLLYALVGIYVVPAIFKPSPFVNFPREGPLLAKK